MLTAFYVYLALQIPAAVLVGKFLKRHAGA